MAFSIASTDEIFILQGMGTARQCNLLRGVRSFLSSSLAGGGSGASGLVPQGLQQALTTGLVTAEDYAVVIMQVGGRFRGPSMQLVRVGDATCPDLRISVTGEVLE
jgi:hypothetical protein